MRSNIYSIWPREGHKLEQLNQFFRCADKRRQVWKLTQRNDKHSNAWQLFTVDIMASVRSIWLQVHSGRHKSNLQNKQILKEGQRPSPGRLIYRAPCKIINMLIDFQLKFENGLQTAGGGRSIFAVWWFHSYHMQQNKQTKNPTVLFLSPNFILQFFFCADA